MERYRSAKTPTATRNSITAFEGKGHLALYEFRDIRVAIHGQPQGVYA